MEALRDEWLRAWPDALAAWSRFTRLRPPTLCLTREEAEAEGLTGSFAMIRLVDQAIVVSLPEVVARGVQPFAAEVLAHEIGHHVLAPATLTDHARSLARMRRGLPTVERHAPMVANLYTDLLINDRLQRSVGLRLSAVYQALARRGEEPGPLWTLYARTYEILWRLERGALGGGATDDRIEGDAWLAARLVRSYATPVARRKRPLRRPAAHVSHRGLGVRRTREAAARHAGRRSRRGRRRPDRRGGRGARRRRASGARSRAGG
jgi:hypothetical protein